MCLLPEYWKMPYFPTLVAGINELETSFLIFVENTDAADSSKEYSAATLLSLTSTILFCTVFLASDLVYLAV